MKKSEKASISSNSIRRNRRWDLGITYRGEIYDVSVIRSL